MKREAPLRTDAKAPASSVTVTRGGSQSEQDADRVGDRVARDHVPDALPRGSAAPLSPPARAHLEPRVGCDLSGVRLHDDARAHATASQLGARAFTIGRDVYFARGQLATETPAGRSLLGHELAHVGQQARGAATGIQRKEDFAGKKPLLIDNEITNSVWVDFVQKTAAKMKLSPDDPRVRAEAERLTAIQIGPTNFERFKEYAQPETLHIDPIKGNETFDRMEREREEEERKAAADSMRLPNGDPWTPGNQRNFNVEEAERLYARVRRLGKDVRDMEYHAIKLKTPEGIQGKIYQYAGGAIGTVVAPTAGTLSKVASLPVQKIIAKARGTKDDTGLDTIADAQVSDAVTGYELMTGELHAIYESTRASYNEFTAASLELVDALVELRKTDDLARSNELMAVVRSAQGKAATAYAAYAIAIELAGVKAKAANLIRLADNTAEGVVFTLETAAALPLGGAAKGGREILKKGEQALEEVAKQAPKVLDDVAKQAPKVVDDVVKQTPKAADDVVKQVPKAADDVVEQVPKAADDVVEQVPKAADDVVKQKPKVTKPKVSKPKVSKPKAPSPDDAAPLRRGPGSSDDVLDASSRAKPRSSTARPPSKEPFYSKRGNRLPMGEAKQPVNVPKPGGDPPKEWVKHLGKKEAQKAMDEFSEVADLPGSENWAKDLGTRNSATTAVGTRGEMRVAAQLKKVEVPIEKVADTIGGQKAGDILTPGRVIDVKTLAIDESYLKLPEFIRQRQIDDMVKQASSWGKRYPGRRPVYIFEGMTKKGIPPKMVKALEEAGVDVRGSLDDLSSLARPP